MRLGVSPPNDVLGSGADALDGSTRGIKVRNALAAHTVHVRGAVGSSP